MNFQEIIRITGKPGLYRLVSTVKGGILAQSIDGNKRIIAPLHTVAPLDNLVIFTREDEIKLARLFRTMFEKQKENLQPPSPKTAVPEITAYFEQVLPGYDHERFLPSHMKKVLQWYHLLNKQNLFPQILENKEA